MVGWLGVCGVSRQMLTLLNKTDIKLLDIQSPVRRCIRQDYKERELDNFDLHRLVMTLSAALVGPKATLAIFLAY